MPPLPLKLLGSGPGPTALGFKVVPPISKRGHPLIGHQPEGVKDPFQAPYLLEHEIPESFGSVYQVSPSSVKAS